MKDFRIVDVFSDVPFKGNPVAVVLNADDLSDAEMQSIAAWINLSETTFHLRSTSFVADYRLRIFTPRSELPFAGHPTLGSAHALLEAGLISARGNRIVQECAAGLVPISASGSTEDRRLELQLPPSSARDLTETEQSRLVSILGAPVFTASTPCLVDVGARWIVAELESVEAVLSLSPDLGASACLETDLRATGVTVFARLGDETDDIEVRSFAPSCGVAEDPVCGSGNGSVAVYRLARGLIDGNSGYVAAQGRCVGRDGQVFVRFEGGNVFIGGQAVTTVSGRIATA